MPKVGKMGYSDYDFKFAKTILKQHFPGFMDEIEDSIKQLQHMLFLGKTKLGRGTRPTPAQILEELLARKGWQRQQPVTPQHKRLKFDLKKDKVAIEIQLSDPSDCYNDFLKFLLAYNLEVIDVAVEIVYDDSVKGTNLPRLSKVRRDLEIYRSVLPCPIWVIGLRPE
ncbi:BglII/BstYI family type II restriction endonuclease [Thermoflexus hugenholtzii]|uniref:BglII/BstYI family type II restriction endonuclease n=1 Tax=Thermoflexus hugenholtzii TaxID=1495650 RepID=UPI000B4FDBFC|nr:BglII/BstYI family type II restriction endonuclease [Thermoflexus hugenholtzii]